MVGDPLNPAAWNRFSYVYGNPVNYTDPSGHNPLLIAAGIGLFALGGFGGHMAATSAGYEVGSPQWYGAVGASGVFAVASGGLGYAGYGVGAFALAVAGDTLVDTVILGGDLGSSLVRNAALNLALDGAGYVVGRTLGRYAPMIVGHPNARNAIVTLDGFVSRAFNGDWGRYNQFLRTLEDGLPDGTSVVVRGSSTTGYKWVTGRPFDGLGPGTSDLDLVLIGRNALKRWHPSEFKIPGLYTTNLGNVTPDVAPSLNPLRLQLQTIAGREVNIQAASRAYMNTRHFIQSSPYLLILEK